MIQHFNFVLKVRYIKSSYLGPMLWMPQIVQWTPSIFSQNLPYSNLQESSALKLNYLHIHLSP